MNPSSALRCDCGYDFTTQTVQGSYLDTAIPKEVKHFGWLLVWYAIGFALVIVGTLTSFSPRKLSSILVATAYFTIVLLGYLALLRRSNSARILLMILMFPFGTFLLGSSVVQMYCFQKVRTVGSK